MRGNQGSPRGPRGRTHRSQPPRIARATFAMRSREGSTENQARFCEASVLVARSCSGCLTISVSGRSVTSMQHYRATRRWLAPHAARLPFAVGTAHAARPPPCVRRRVTGEPDRNSKPKPLGLDCYADGCASRAHRDIRTARARLKTFRRQRPAAPCARRVTVSPLLG